MTANTCSDEAPVINIHGERVALGPPRRDLVPLYLRWRNEFQGMSRLMDVDVVTMEQEIARYEQLTDGRTIRFTIYQKPSREPRTHRYRPIGSTALNDIDFRSRTAVFSILIGEPDARGKGYGTEATRLMLDYAFTALGLHSVFLYVFAFNSVARHVYEKIGFREIGRRRESQFAGGRLWDTIYMDILASEFESPVLGKVFVPD